MRDDLLLPMSAHLGFVLPLKRARGSEARRAQGVVGMRGTSGTYAVPHPFRTAHKKIICPRPRPPLSGIYINLGAVPALLSVFFFSLPSLFFLPTASLSHSSALPPSCTLVLVLVLSCLLYLSIYPCSSLHSPCHCTNTSAF